MEYKDRIKNSMNRYALTTFGKNLEECNIKEKHMSLSKAIMEEIVPLWRKSEGKFEGKKRAYYL